MDQPYTVMEQRESLVTVKRHVRPLINVKGWGKVQPIITADMEINRDDNR